jgi:hypothetical protein
MAPAAFPIGGENYMRTSRPIFSRAGRSSSVSRPFETAYPASVEQTGEDYSNIMQGYQNILNEPQDTRFGDLYSQYQGLLNRSPITPERQTYSEDPNVSASLGILKDLATTGGLSEADIQNLRARGVSPIRAVYANMQRNLDRQRSLGGGYSPNYGAVTARMAREMSEQAAGATTDVNARIAEMVQSGKLSSAPQFASFAGREAEAKRGIDRFNIENALRAQELGSGRELAALSGMRDILNQPDRRLQALSGMTSLYGTTPALASTFGNQALSAAELQQRAVQASQATAANAFANIARNQPQQRIIQQPSFSPRYQSPLRTPLTGRPVGGTTALRRFYGG